MSEPYNIEALIIRYLQQEIAEEELRELEAWLEASPDHKAYFFQIKHVVDLGHYPLFTDEKLKEFSWQRMKKRMEREVASQLNCTAAEGPAGIRALDESLVPEETTRGKSKNRSFGKRILLRYAAALLCMVAIGWGVSEYRLHRFALSHRMVPSPAMNEIRVPEGGRANTLILSDGSKVILNASTNFKYPASFDAVAKREVYLEGEAYFEVSHNENKPFVVKLKKQHITVLGTTFNIEAYADQPYSITTLLSGSIGLEAFNERGESANHLLLKPNQRAYSDNRTGEVSLMNIDASLARAWTHGEYKFKDEPLVSIIRKLEHTYGVCIFLESDSLQQIRYTGTFSYNQDIMDVLHIINYEKQFVFKRAGKNIFISKR